MLSNRKKVLLSLNKTAFKRKGRGVHIDDGVHIEHPEHIELGNDTKINRGAILFTQKAKREFPAGSISIGENTLISYNTVIFAGRGTIVIGDHTEVGLNCCIVAQKRTASRRETSGPEGLEWFDTCIGSDCLFGTGAMVLEGSKIGDRCVVAAGAVVQGVYPDDTTLVGNPARAIPSIRKK